MPESKQKNIAPKKAVDVSAMEDSAGGAAEKLTLRPYQKEMIDTVNGLPDHCRTVCVLATGLGKTLTAANFDFHGHVLWLSHRDELVRQPERYFAMRGMSFGIEKAEETSHGEDVVSASVQTLSRPGRMEKFEPDYFDTIIVDEAQHAAAPTYRKILDYFSPCRKLIGLTATPRRGDKVRLTDTFDDICFNRDLRWGIRNHYLSPIRCVRVSSDFDINAIKTEMGDYSASSISEEQMNSDNDSVVARAYMDYCYPEGRQTLIYCPTVSVCISVLGTIRRLLPEKDKDTVQMIYDGLSTDERRQILSDYQAGRVKAIVNCMILTEGVDLPSTSVIVCDRPTVNSSLYTQIVGRGTRLYPGKDHCLVVDVVGKNAEGHYICTAPSLFGIDPDALPKSIRGEIEQKPLDEIADELLNQQAAKAKSIHLLREMVDIFAEERKDLIEENKSKGTAAIAAAYEKQIDDENDLGDEFADLVIKKEPTAERRYHIRPGFVGDIYLSEPDLTGNVNVTFDIPAIYQEAPIRFSDVPMKLSDASRIIHDTLNLIMPEYMSTTWSRKAREEQDKQPATAKQAGYVKKAYGKYKVANVRKPITKKQASDLIELDKQIEELEKQSAAYTEREKQEKAAAPVLASTEVSLEPLDLKTRKKKSKEAPIQQEPTEEEQRAEEERQKAASLAAKQELDRRLDKIRNAAKNAKIKTYEVYCDASYS